MKKLFYLFLIIIISISLSSCWDRKEPKSLSIVESALYDVKENGTYVTIGQILNPTQSGSQTRSSNSANTTSIIAISEGSSLLEAIQNISMIHAKNVFSGHSKIRLFTERFIRQDQLSSMDYFLRTPFFDEKPLLIMIKGDNIDPISVYGADLGLSEDVGDFIENMSQSQPYQTSMSVFVSNLDFIIDYYEAGKQPVMGAIEIITTNAVPSKENSSTSNSSSSKEKLRYEGLAAFKDNQFVGYMNGEETRAYNFVTDNMKWSYLTVSLEQGDVSIAVTDSKPTIHTKLEDDIPIIDVKIIFDFGMIQNDGPLDVSSGKGLAIMEKAINKEIQEQIEKAIEKAQEEFNSDIFGFGTVMHREHPKQWEALEENWDDHFSKAIINVEVDGTNTRHGTIKRPFKMEE